jgi:hypothetical protein
MPAHVVDSGILVDVALHTASTLGSRDTSQGSDLYVAFT